VTTAIAQVCSGTQVNPASSPTPVVPNPASQQSAVTPLNPRAATQSTTDPRLAQPNAPAAQSSLAPRAASEAYRTIDRSNLEIDVAGEDGKLILDANVRVLSANEIGRNPTWAAYLAEQRAAGNEVFWVSMEGRIEWDTPTLSLPTDDGDRARFTGDSDAEMILTVPVVVPAARAESVRALRNAFARDLNRAITSFPSTRDAARALPGPWELTLGGTWGVGNDVKWEVLTHLNKSGDTLVADITRQVAPTTGIGRGVDFATNGVRVSVDADQSARLVRVEEDRFTLDLERAKGSAYDALATLRKPKRGRGVSHQERERSHHGDAITTDLSLAIAFRGSSIRASAVRERLFDDDPMITRDEIRSGALAERGASYERLALNLAPSVGHSQSVSVGPVTVGGSVRASWGRYEEMLVERPSSLLDNVQSSVRNMLSVPETAAELLERSPGEQFRTMTIRRRSAGTRVGKGVSYGVGPLTATAGASTGVTASLAQIRDIKRYLLPNGHLLVDVRHYDATQVRSQTELKATLDLFSRDDAEELIADYLDGRLSGPLAKLVDKHFGEVGVVARHYAGVHQHQHERLLRAELDLNNETHRQILALIQKDELDLAAARLEQLSIAGESLSYVVEAPSADAEHVTLERRLPGGVVVALQAERGAETRTHESHVASDNQLVVSYESDRVAEAGFPTSASLGAHIGKEKFELLARTAFRGHTTETAKTSVEGQDGSTEVITIERNEAVHRVTRKVLWANDSRSYHLVTFREKTNTGSWSNPEVYVVADHSSHEWISRGDVKELQRFAAVVGGDIRVEHVGDGNNFIEGVFGLRRYGDGDVRVRCWIPFEGLKQLGQASADDIYQAAAITAAFMDGEPNRELPGWAKDHPEARQELANYLVNRNNNDQKSNDANWAYNALVGENVWKNNSSKDFEAFRAANHIVRLRNALNTATRSMDASESRAADLWRDFGAKVGQDFWKLAIIRWASLIARDPEAVERRHGSDDLFFVDQLELSSDASVKVARERAVPNHARRMQQARRRAVTGYRLQSL